MEDQTEKKESPPKTIGERMREYRDEFGPEALIKICEISSSYSQKLISGDECLRAKTKNKILAALEKAGF